MKKTLTLILLAACFAANAEIQTADPNELIGFSKMVHRWPINGDLDESETPDFSDNLSTTTIPMYVRMYSDEEWDELKKPITIDSNTIIGVSRIETSWDVDDRYIELKDAVIIDTNMTRGIFRAIPKMAGTNDIIGASSKVNPLPIEGDSNESIILDVATFWRSDDGDLIKPIQGGVVNRWPLDGDLIELELSDISNFWTAADAERIKSETPETADTNPILEEPAQDEPAAQAKRIAWLWWLAIPAVAVVWLARRNAALHKNAGR